MEIDREREVDLLEKKKRKIKEENVNNTWVTSMAKYNIEPYRQEQLKMPERWHTWCVPFWNGLDVFEQSVNMTGKVCDGILRKLDYTSSKYQCLVLAPTQELVDHISSVFLKLLRGQNVLVCGARDVKRGANLMLGPHVVVETPAQVLALLETKYLHLGDIKIFVLNEANRMFAHCWAQIYLIYQHLPSKVQVCDFSNPTPSYTVDMAYGFMCKPVKWTLNGAKHYFTKLMNEASKVGVICNLYSTLIRIKTVIFVSTRTSYQYLIDNIHDYLDDGKINQNNRDFGMRYFFPGVHGLETGVTIAIDPNDCLYEFNASVVINYDLPTKPLTYLSRIGRSGVKADVINCITEKDWWLLFDIRRLCKLNFSLGPSRSWRHQIASNEAIEVRSTSMVNLPQEGSQGAEQYDSEMSEWLVS